jgi:putative transposase
MKPGTFTQMYVQIVFAVRNREALLDKNMRKRVLEYIGGIINTMKHKVIIINGVSDHVHIFLGLNPTKSVADTVHEVKRCSSFFINSERLCKHKFEWQEGYGAFTYSHSQIDNVFRYIKNQEAHHAKNSFKEEYDQFLREFEIDHDVRYLFNYFENV